MDDDALLLQKALLAVPRKPAMLQVSLYGLALVCFLATALALLEPVSLHQPEASLPAVTGLPAATGLQQAPALKLERSLSLRGVCIQCRRNSNV